VTSPIRVAHVVGSTGLYGAERWILALLRYLAPDRVQAAVVNLVDEPGQSSDVIGAAAQRGIRAVDLYTGGRFNPAGIFRLARFIGESDYDIIHSHGYKADVLGLLAARLRGARIVSTPHGWSKEQDKRLSLYESLDRLALRLVDYACPLSPELGDDLRSMGVPQRKIRMVLNAVDVDEVDEIAPAMERRPGETVVGYMGQLIRRKNLDCLITAFGRVAAERADVQLTIVGDGPLSGEMRASLARIGLSRRVRFTGYRADGVAMLKTFDVLVLPSWLEGIPRCVMEAMAAGVPVLASDIAGNRALIEDGETGLLFPPDDPARLAKAIVSMIEQPERAKTMAGRARTKIERSFSAQRMADEYAALYEECLTSCS